MAWNCHGAIDSVGKCKVGVRIDVKYDLTLIQIVVVNEEPVTVKYILSYCVWDAVKMVWYF